MCIHLNHSDIAHEAQLARLVKKSGAVYQEVMLEIEGEWAPQHVFRSVPFDAIIRVGNDLVEM